MRTITSVLIMGFLAACAPAIPDSGAGVGFDNSDTAQRDREAALNTWQPLGQPLGQPLAFPGMLSDETLTPPAPVSSAPLPARPGTSTGSSADIAAETAAALAAASANSGQAPLQASPANPALQSAAGISDENDFAAVSDRQTISSDAERLARNRAEFQVIEPTALPTRAGPAQPNIVEFALATSNPRGTSIHRRTGFFDSAARTARNCARFASPDRAQIEFLSSGGPQRDRRGLDPDGDGFACSWDPARFRQAAKN